MKHWLKRLSLVFALLALLGLACSEAVVLGPAGTDLAEPTPEIAGERAEVVRVIDGDTIVVALDGFEYHVRYVGIDTPERGEPFYQAATDANEQLVGGGTVILVRDISDTDRYDRLLRYIYLPDGTFVNGELVRMGLAQAKMYRPDVAFNDLLESLESEARAAGNGMWGP